MEIAPSGGQKRKADNVQASPSTPNQELPCNQSEAEGRIEKIQASPSPPKQEALCNQSSKYPMARAKHLDKEQVALYRLRHTPAMVLTEPRKLKRCKNLGNKK